MEILLDTSFLLTCIKEKIDFFDSEKYGQLLLPREAIKELKELKKKGKPIEKERSKLVLEIIENNKERFEFVDLGEDYVDKGIIEYVKSNKVIVATIDKELKRKVKEYSRIITIRGGKKIVLI